jgi:hypothetical protein
LHYTVGIAQTSAAVEPDRYDDAERQGNPPNNTLADATFLPNVAGGDVFSGPGPGPDRFWTMFVPNLTLHDGSDQDFFRLDLPDEAGDDCLDVVPECANGARVGNGMLDIYVHHTGGAQIIGYDALGNELGRGANHLRVGCPRGSGLDPFYFVVTNHRGCKAAYALEIVYAVPDLGLWERFGDRCIPCPPGACGDGDDDSFRVITPPEEAWNDFIFGIDCDPIVCQPPKSDYLFFHWALEGPAEFEIQHEASAGFEFALLDERFNRIGVAAPVGGAAGGVRVATNLLVTQRLSLTHLSPGYYVLRVTGSQFGATFSVRFVTSETPPLRIDGTTVRWIGSQFQFRWNSQIGRRYQVQYKNQLNDPTWSNIGSPITATGPTAFVADPVSSQRSGFYRVVRLD